MTGPRTPEDEIRRIEAELDEREGKPPPPEEQPPAIYAFGVWFGIILYGIAFWVGVVYGIYRLVAVFD